MSSWAREVMIRPVLVLRCGSAGGLKSRDDVSGCETSVSLAGGKLM